MSEIIKQHLAAFATLIALSVGIAMPPNSASAQECTISEVKVFATNFCPRTWADAAGQILPINGNQALFSLIGTTYGGDGRTTFGLPDLRSRTVVGGGMGQGIGLDLIQSGRIGGLPTHRLSINEMPAHNHALRGTNRIADQKRPNGDLLAFPDVIINDQPLDIYENGNLADATLNDLSIGQTGGNVPFSIRDPYLGMRYCICLTGIFPSRN